MNSIIQCVDLKKVYQVGGHEVAALDGVTLNVERNDYLAIMGQSGSGKSTMMNILGCLDTPSSGSYILNGRNVALLSDADLAVTRNREIGFIFQSFNLLPRLTAVENVARPLVYRGIPRMERLARARAALERVGLETRFNHRPNELSGGQCQRVAIARALVGDPSILLADEPTGNLDSETSREIIGLFNELHATGNTIILITHEQHIADCCERSVILSDGRLIKDSGSEAVYAS